jgi:hypothetical protein
MIGRLDTLKDESMADNQSPAASQTEGQLQREVPGLAEY